MTYPTNKITDAKNHHAITDTLRNTFVIVRNISINDLKKIKYESKQYTHKDSSKIKYTIVSYHIFNLMRDVTPSE